MGQRMAVVWIGLRCFRLNAPQRAVSRASSSTLIHFSLWYLKCQQKLWTGNDQFNSIQECLNKGRCYSASDDTICYSNCAAEDVCGSKLFCFFLQNPLEEQYQTSPMKRNPKGTFYWFAETLCFYNDPTNFYIPSGLWLQWCHPCLNDSEFRTF